MPHVAMYKWTERNKDLHCIVLKDRLDNCDCHENMYTDNIIGISKPTYVLERSGFEKAFIVIRNRGVLYMRL